jgi:PPP family 3-phenylpropionic acid transporter
MKNRSLTYLSVYLFAYGAMGVFMPLIGQYLNAIGFSGTQIGTITSAGTATAIFATVFWGKLYNKSENKKNVILKLIIAAALVCLSLYFVHMYTVFLLMFCVLYFFQAPAVTLIDAMTIEDGQLFGAARKWGAVGFALGVFFAGRIAEITGLSVIFFLYAGCFIVFAAIIYIMSTGSADKKPAPPESLKPKVAIYKNKKYIKLVICAFFVNGTITANNTYFGFLFIEGGGTIAGIGLAFLLMAGSEAPFMAWADKLAKTFTLEKTLLAAMCLSAVRYAWYAGGPPASLLIGLFFLQGMTVGIIIVEFVRYIAKIVDTEELGFAIAVYYALSSGLSGIFCQMAGGIILDHFHAGGIYVFFSCMNLLGASIYIVGKLYKSE